MAQCLYQQALKNHLPQYVSGNSLILHANPLPATSNNIQGFRKGYELITYLSKKILYQMAKADNCPILKCDTFYALLLLE